jgi:hypothetical protein
MNLLTVNDIKNYILNKKIKVHKTNSKASMLSVLSTVFFASITGFCIAHDNTKGLENFLYFMGFCFSSLLSIGSLVFSIMSFLEIAKLKRLNIIEFGYLTIDVLKENDMLSNPFLKPSFYQNYQSIINSMIATSITTEQIEKNKLIFSTEEVELFNETFIYNKTLLEQHSFDIMPKELQEKILFNARYLNNQIAMIMKKINELHLCENQKFKTLIEDSNIEKNFSILKDLENNINQETMSNKKEIVDLEKAFHQELKKSSLNKTKESKSLNLKL